MERLLVAILARLRRNLLVWRAMAFYWISCRIVPLLSVDAESDTVEMEWLSLSLWSSCCYKRTTLDGMTQSARETDMPQCESWLIQRNQSIDKRGSDRKVRIH
jgi:hypothetical protein